MVTENPPTSSPPPPPLTKNSNPTKRPMGFQEMKDRVRTSADRDPEDVCMIQGGDSCASQISISDPDEFGDFHDFFTDIQMPHSFDQTNPTHYQFSGPELEEALMTCPNPYTTDHIPISDPDELGAFADLLNEILIDQANPTHCQVSDTEPEETVLTCPPPARTNPGSGPYTNVLAVEKEYNPKAVVDLFVRETSTSSRGKCASLAELRKKARKHLSYMGWVLWYKDKKKGKRELRYSSPSGVCYYSLRMACKGAMEDDDARLAVKKNFKPRKTKVQPR